MPPLPRSRSTALAGLCAWLDTQGPEVIEAVVRAGESLAGEIDIDRSYPRAWLEFRLAGDRGFTGAGGEHASVPGGDVMADLAAFVERASVRLAAAPGAGLSPESLGVRWGVSRKTIDRYRKRGLIGRRCGPGGGRLEFARPVVEAFERSHRAEIERARGFTRLDASARGEVERLARELASAGHTRHQAAGIIAERVGRSREAIRSILVRLDRPWGERDRAEVGGDARAPVFGERGPASERERRLVARAARRWIDVGEVAKRLGRSLRSVSRVATDARADALRGMRSAIDLAAGTARKRSLDGVGDGVGEILSHPSVLRGLGMTGERDLLAFVRSARATPAPIGVEERARAEARRALLRRAAESIAALPARGASPTLVERVETDLRWASRLKAELIRAQFGVLVRTIEARLAAEGLPGLESLRSGDLWPLLRTGVAAVGEAVDGFDGARGGRLAARAGLAIDRAAAVWVRAHGTPRTASSGPSDAARARREKGGVGGSHRGASPRLVEGVAIEDWTARVDPWSALVEPPGVVRASLERVSERAAVLLRARFGWSEIGRDSGPPRTREDIRSAGVLGVAPLRDLPVVKLSVMERGAIAAARRPPKAKTRSHAGPGGRA